MLQTETIEFGWKAANYRLQTAIIDWLSDLARMTSPEASLGAAIGAGTLFTIDPRHIERILIRPWALSGEPAAIRAAGMALGMPVIRGRDAAGARLLAAQWAKSQSLYLQLCATAAYGGLLGAWDVSANAAANLWDIGKSSTPLLSEANVGLAQLMIAGRSAVRSRGSVLALLESQLAIKPAHSTRVRDVFGLIVLFLSSPLRNAKHSFDSLLSNESEAKRTFFHLLSDCIANGESDSAYMCIDSLIDAVANRRLDRTTLVNIIRGARDCAAASGFRRRMGTRLRSMLLSLANATSYEKESEIADALLWHFFEVGGRSRNARR